MKNAVPGAKDSMLYVSSALETLAQQLSDDLLEEERTAKNPFLSANIIVPNNNLKKWLQLYLAAQQRAAINLRVLYLEDALEKILAAIGTVSYPHKLRIVDHDRYRLMLLSVLLDPQVGGADLQPLREYIGVHNPARREFSGRAWDVADRLARLIRDYEFHRQDELIQHWLKNEDAFPDASKEVRAMERCQRALFRLVVDEPNGLRARLSAYSRQTFKTLPQFANEVMERPLKPRDEWPEYLRERPIHIFGVAQISSFHVRILRRLSTQLDLRFYHVNPLAAQIEEPRTRGGAVSAMRNVAERFQFGGRLPATDGAGLRLLAKWAHAGGESLWRLSELLMPEKTSVPTCALKVLPSAQAESGPTVLQRLQAQLLNQGENDSRIPQDKSLQIVGCPGIAREVETVYNSILENLRTVRGLKLNDIAVLVPDMALYRPVIQTIFDRQVAGTFEHDGRTLPYNMSDYSAAGPSVFGQALLGMLQLPLEGFGRVEVFDVLLNPCFLARLGVTREQAMQWLEWAERLGIYHGWDRDDKKELSYGESRLYSWHLALQRLRLGRIMDVPQNGGTALPKFNDVVPYADLESSDARQLNAFCRAVQGLLPRLLELRRLDASGASWHARLLALAADFLDVPEDRSGETQVRDALLGATQALSTLDAVRESGERTLSLPLVIEFVQAKLAELECGDGVYLSGGVTVSSLQPLRPIPFQIVYILGMGEGLFPRKNASSAFDLREVKRCRGDILPDEAQRFQFLEALLSARRKLYLLYSCKEIQKDQDLQPCLALTRLRQHVSQYILPQVDGAPAEFQIVKTPLYGHDSGHVSDSQLTDIADIFANYSQAEHMLSRAPVDALKRGEAIRQSLLALPPPATAALDRIPHVSLADLKRFLCDPADAALRRHLRVRDEDESEPCNDEPFYTEAWESENLVTQTLGNVVVNAASGKKSACEDWTEEFEQTYRARMLQGQTPEGAFAQVDERRIRKTIAERLDDKEGVSGLLARLVSAEFCGAVQIGESQMPTPAGLRFAALRLELPEAEVLLDGRMEYVWRTESTLEALVICSANKESGKKPVTRLMLEPALFYFALLAGSDTAEWLGERRFNVSISCKNGMDTYSFAGISPAEAREYLTRLAAEFLDQTTFDSLPLVTILGDKKLHAPFLAANADGVAAEQKLAYAYQLSSAIADREEDTFSRDDRLKVADLVETRVPDDAFDKLHRRFRLIQTASTADVEAQNAPETIEAPAVLKAPARSRAKKKSSGGAA
jgi:exodeoxyribonuclease V gamma subunit